MNVWPITAHQAKQRAILALRWMKVCLDAGEIDEARELSEEASRMTQLALDLESPEPCELEF